MDERDYERLRDLFQAAPVAIAVQRGAELVYQLANDVYQRFLGGRPLVGKRLDQVLPPEASLRGILQRVFASGEPYAGKEFPFLVDREGSGGFSDKAYFNFICQPTRDAAGLIDGVVTFGVEVTEQVSARQQVEALATELRQAVHARDEFLSIASHELKTPLTPILLQAQLLRRHLDAGRLDPDEVRERVDMMERSVARVNELVNALLDVSRITTDRLELSLAEVDVVERVHDAVDQLRAMLERSGSTVTVEAPGAVRGTWDRLRLDQVLVNLMANAIKYGAGRPIVVRVRSGEGVVCVDVIDRGIGIAPADQARIFDRFERAVSVRHYGGFGLGLWIVRQLVEALGGSIRVASELGEGSTFTVELPRHS